jgi:hypothetical protein
MRAFFIFLTLTLVPLKESQAMKFNCEDSLGLSSKLEINTASKTAKYAAHYQTNYQEINGFWVWTTSYVENGNEPFIKSYVFMFNKRDQKMTTTMSHFSDKFVKELGLQQVSMSKLQCTRPLD